MDYLEISKSLAARNPRRDGEGEAHPAVAYAIIRPTRECPKCGSRQWVRTTEAEHWVCYECPKTNGTKINAIDVVQWHIIPLESLSLKARNPELPAVHTGLCPQCGGRQFWRGIVGPFVCYRCARPDDYPRNLSVEEWWYVAP
jgi:hypothetical protein